MLIVPCLSCYTAVRVLGDIEKIDPLVGRSSEYWPDKFTCVSCGAPCAGMLETEVEGSVLTRLKVRELTSEELYAAQLGLGTPDESSCDLATVRDLFENKRVIRVKGQTVPGTTRTCVHELEFEDGFKVFFGASSHGAVIYRISRPFSYANRVIEELDL